MNQSMVPQGLMAPMMPLPYNVSGMSTTPTDVQRPGPVPMSTLASALASATPENQRLVSYLSSVSVEIFLVREIMKIPIILSTKIGFPIN